MRSFLLRVVVSGAAIWLAALIVPGVELGDGSTTDQVLTALVVGLLFGLVNAVIKPIVALVTLPLYLLTLGLFSLLVNALLLWLTAWVAQGIDVPFTVEGFWAAVFGALVVSVATVVLDALLPD